MCVLQTSKPKTNPGHLQVWLLEVWMLRYHQCYLARQYIPLTYLQLPYLKLRLAFIKRPAKNQTSILPYLKLPFKSHTEERNKSDKSMQAMALDSPRRGDGPAGCETQKRKPELLLFVARKGKHRVWGKIRLQLFQIVNRKGDHQRVWGKPK